MRALRAPALRALPRGARSRARGCVRCALSRAALTPACTFAPTSYIWLTHASARAGMRALSRCARSRAAHVPAQGDACAPALRAHALERVYVRSHAHPQRIQLCLFAGPLGSIMTRHDRPFGPLWRARVICFAICIIVTTIFRAIPSGNIQPVEFNLTKTGLVMNETFELWNGSLGCCWHAARKEEKLRYSSSQGGRRESVRELKKENASFIFKTILDGYG